jgi:hypothetical protein
MRIPKAVKTDPSRAFSPLISDTPTHRNNASPGRMNTGNIISEILETLKVFAT